MGRAEETGALREEFLAELWEYQVRLSELRGRITLLDKVEKTFDKASRGKQFEVRNDITWWTLRDAHDMLVIHLASFVRGLSDDGGLFPRIRGKWLPVLKSHPPTTAPGDRDFRRHAQEIVSERFPDAGERGRIRVEHLDACIKAFSAKLLPLLRDRDRNRAHRYQHESVGKAEVLSTRDLWPIIEEIQELLQDLRFLADTSMFGYPDSVFLAPAGGTAQELVDQVLLGVRVQRDLLEERLLSGRNDLPYYWQRRQRVYELLHARHDALPDPEAECFNSDDAIIVID